MSKVGTETERTRVWLEDFREAARESLSPPIFDYIDGGAESEATCVANRRDFKRIGLLPLVARDVAAPDLSVGLLGYRHSLPLGIAPAAFHRLAHAEGERATLCAAAALDIPMVVSAMTSLPLEEIAAEARSATLWFQTYIFRDRGVTRALVERAEAAGYRAILVTLGTPAPGKRDRNLRNRFRLPEGVLPANFVRRETADCNNPISGLVSADLDPTLTWDDLHWLTGITHLPLVVKGVMNPADVCPAVGAGVAGIVVSNHGGRQLDTSVSTIRALPAVVERAAGRVPIMVDSGFRRGTDVLKALALGADVVFLGRPVFWGLACAGAEGVCQVMTLLADELRLSMQLVGCPSLAALRAEASRILVST